MPFECHGLCYQVEVAPSMHGNYKYLEKYCSVCEKFVKVFSKSCPCCATILRIDRKNKNRRRQKYF